MKKAIVPASGAVVKAHEKEGCFCSDPYSFFFAKFRIEVPTRIEQ